MGERPITVTEFVEKEYGVLRRRMFQTAGDFRLWSSDPTRQFWRQGFNCIYQNQFFLTLSLGQSFPYVMPTLYVLKYNPDDNSTEPLRSHDGRIIGTYHDNNHSHTFHNLGYDPKAGTRICYMRPSDWTTWKPECLFTILIQAALWLEEYKRQMPVRVLAAEMGNVFLENRECVPSGQDLGLNTSKPPSMTGISRVVKRMGRTPRSTLCVAFELNALLYAGQREQLQNEQVSKLHASYIGCHASHKDKVSVEVWTKQMANMTRTGAAVAGAGAVAASVAVAAPVALTALSAIAAASEVVKLIDSLLTAPERFQANEVRCLWLTRGLNLMRKQLWRVKQIAQRDDTAATIDALRFCHLAVLYSKEVLENYKKRTWYQKLLRGQRNQDEFDEAGRKLIEATTHLISSQSLETYAILNDWRAEDKSERHRQALAIVEELAKVAENQTEDKDEIKVYIQQSLDRIFQDLAVQSDEQVRLVSRLEALASKRVEGDQTNREQMEELMKDLGELRKDMAASLVSPARKQQRRRGAGSTETCNLDRSRLILQETPIGRGGFGSVYRGLYNQRKVAVKKLSSPETCSGEQLKKEFRHEIEALATLRHRNVVAFYGYTMESHDEALIVMEYASAGSLERILHRRDAGSSEPPSLLTRVGYACHLFCGLWYIHEKDVVHRDLTSSNLVVDGSGILKIADFGLSKVLRSSRGAQESSDRFRPVGKRAYWAPEVAHAEFRPFEQQEQSVGSDGEIRASARAYWKPVDVYAAGIVLYELNTCLVPWQGVPDMRGIPPMRSDRPLAERRPLVSEEARKKGSEKLFLLMQNCWADNPLERPSSNEGAEWEETLHQEYQRLCIEPMPAWIRDPENDYGPSLPVNNDEDEVAEPILHVAELQKFGGTVTCSSGSSDIVHFPKSENWWSCTETVREHVRDQIATLNDIANVYHAHGNIRAAETIYRHALSLARNAFGECNPVYVAPLANNLALLYHVQSRPEDAQRLLQECIYMCIPADECKSLPYVDLLDVAKYFNNFGQILIEQVDCSFRILGPTKRQVHGSLDLESANELLEEAQEALENAVALKYRHGNGRCEKAKASFATSLINLAVAVYLQGKALYSQSKFEESQSKFEESQSKFEEAFRIAEGAREIADLPKVRHWHKTIMKCLTSANKERR